MHNINVILARRFCKSEPSGAGEGSLLDKALTGHSEFEFR